MPVKMSCQLVKKKKSTRNFTKIPAFSLRTRLRLHLFSCMVVAHDHYFEQKHLIVVTVNSRREGRGVGANMSTLHILYMRVGCLNHDCK